MSPFVAGIAAFLSASPPVGIAPSAEAQAQAAVARSRGTRATYSLYNWNWVRGPDGGPRQEWSAEFHSGRLHRVETPHVRLVADCAARTGKAIDFSTGQTVTGEGVADVACGISARPAVLATDWLARRDSRFGAVDLIRLTSDENLHIYAVDGEGILIAAEILPRDPASPVCLQSQAVAVERSLPEGDTFSEASLDRSVVAERYRSAPASPARNLWTREPFCF